MASRISGFGDIHQGAGNSRCAVAGIGAFPSLIQQLTRSLSIQGKAAGRGGLTAILDANCDFKGLFAAFSRAVAPP
jgi:hypothetical protein